MQKITIDKYIASVPLPVRTILQKIRQVIRSEAPNAKEVISYRIPAFRLNGILVYFAAFTNHIGIYPPITGSPSLMKQLKRYSGPKGNLKFPLDEPIPYDLIGKIVRLRVKQDVRRRAKRVSKKK